MGILSLGITPERASSEVSNRFRAILITSPEKMGGLDEYVSMLKRFSLGAPVFALYSDKNRFDEAESAADPFNKVFYGTGISYDLIFGIIKYQKCRGMKPIGNYKILGMNISIFTDRTLFFDVPMNFTKTETMIIRFLAVMFSTPAKAADILKFAFKSSKCPEISNIRTHISSINKKCMVYLHRPFIKSENRQGYIVSTPPLVLKNNNDS